MSDSTSTLRPGVAIVIAGLLMFASGAMDAFTFVGHGGVFANAQSGNVILAGIAIVSGHWESAGSKILPIAAFLVGTVVVRQIQRLSPRWGWSPEMACLLTEVLVLSPLAFVGHLFSNVSVALMVAFAAALQFMGFTTAGAWNYTSIATTGNLRRLADALIAVVASPNDREAHRRALTFSVVCSAFFLGAAAGALATRQWRDLAILVPVGCQLAVLGILAEHGGVPSQATGSKKPYEKNGANADAIRTDG